MNLQSRVTFFKAGICITLAVAILAIYCQVGGHSFIRYDDEEYILLNSRLRIGFTSENIRWFLTSLHVSNWHPLTWYSHILDVKLFGINPMGHHYVNVLLHGANSILLFLFLNRLTGCLWRSAAVAALFAVHPINVESVAWIAERKNLLSTLFWMVTLHLYANYTTHKSRFYYILTVIAFALGLMSKQMLVSIPLIMFLLDYWPLQRLHAASGVEVFKSLIIEKVPFLLLALSASVIAVVSQDKALGSLQSTTLLERVANASESYIRYIRKIFWPNDLAPFYPFPESIHVMEVVIASLMLIAITTTSVKLRTRYPFLFVGWFWFLLTLVPVIGIVKIGLQSMADRYAYIPAIGIFIIIVWTLSKLTENLRLRKLITGMSGVCIILLSVTAWRQTSYWKDSMTLFSRTLAVTDGNYIALCAIGRELEREGKLDEALQKFDEAIKIAPWYEYAQTHQGIIQMNRGKVDAAVFKYNEAILQNPTTVPGHINLGILMAMQGNLNEAATNFRIALDFDPRSATANYNLAITLFKLGQNDEAVKHYKKSLETDPTDYECHFNLGIALEELKQFDEATQHFREALRLRPDFTPAAEKLDFFSKRLTTADEK